MQFLEYKVSKFVCAYFPFAPIHLKKDNAFTMGEFTTIRK